MRCPGPEQQDRKTAVLHGAGLSVSAAALPNATALCIVDMLVPASAALGGARSNLGQSSQVRRAPTSLATANICEDWGWAAVEKGEGGKGYGGVPVI